MHTQKCLCRREASTEPATFPRSGFASFSSPGQSDIGSVWSQSSAGDDLTGSSASTARPTVTRQGRDPMSSPPGGGGGGATSPTAAPATSIAPSPGDRSSQCSDVFSLEGAVRHARRAARSQLASSLSPARSSQSSDISEVISLISPQKIPAISLISPEKKSRSTTVEFCRTGTIEFAHSDTITDLRSPVKSEFPDVKLERQPAIKIEHSRLRVASQSSIKEEQDANREGRQSSTQTTAARQHPPGHSTEVSLKSEQTACDRVSK